jgi:hypothetical protein
VEFELDVREINALYHLDNAIVHRTTNAKLPIVVSSEESIASNGQI